MRTLAVVGVVGLSACLTVQANRLELRHNQKLLFDKTALSKTAHGWSEGELKTLPSATTINGTNVSYHASGVGAANPSEVYLFNRDPEEVRKTLAFKAFEAFKWPHEIIAPSVLPRVVVVPFPPNASFDVKQTLSVNLTESMFWDGQVTGRAAAPSGHGSVKAVRVIQRGVCSREAPATTDILELVENKVWMELREKFRGGKLSCADYIRRPYTRGILYMGHDSGVPLDVTGGFLLQFSVLLTNPTFDITLWANYQYELGLDDGILAITGVRENTVEVRNTSVFQTTLEPDAREALTNLLPKLFREFALKAQTLPIPNQKQCALANDGTETTDTSECGLVVSGLQAQVALGGASLGLASNEISALQSAVGQQQNGVLRNWRCSEKAGKSCSLVLRARRINVLPDAVEMVWFDDKDLNSTAYALWVALHAPNSNPNDLAQLCNPRPERGLNNTPAAYTRSFAQSDLGALQVPACGP